MKWQIHRKYGKFVVDKIHALLYNNQVTHRGIAQMVEQRSPKPRVVSSSLTLSIELYNIRL